MFRVSFFVLLLGLLYGPGALAAPPPDGPQVRLLSAGAEPRAPLRYAFKVGETERMVMDMDMSMGMTMGSIKQPKIALPTMRMGMSVEKQRLTADGDLEYSFRLDGAEVLAGPEANAIMVAAMRGELKNTEGMAGRVTVSPRGFTRAVEFSMPPNASAQLRQISGNLKQSIRQMSAPFPKEPVGVGARWEVIMVIKTDALTLEQVAIYELTARTGQTGTFKVGIQQSAQPQTMRAPGLPPGTKVQLKALKGSGTGEVSFDLARVVPTSSGLMEMVMGLEVSQGSTKQVMGMDMSVGVEMRPK